MIRLFNYINKQLIYYIKKFIIYIFWIIFGVYLVFILRYSYYLHFKPKAVIININGAPSIKGSGLGNQFFTFSLGYIFTKETGIKKNISINNLEPCKNSREDFTDINKRCYALDKFGITIPSTYNFSGLSIIEKERLYNINILYDYKKSYVNKIILINMPDLYNYYSQFKKYIKDIQGLFEYQEELSSVSKNMLKEIENSNNSVSIHIRRGDFVKLRLNYDLSYQIKSAYLMANKILDPNFFIFSDDPQFVKDFFKNINNFNTQSIIINKINNKQFNNKKLNKVSIQQIYQKLNNAIYVSEKVNHSLEEFYLMSKCKHNIIANSTFSFWAAFLNKNSKKIIIAPAKDIWGDAFMPFNLNWTTIS